MFVAVNWKLHFPVYNSVTEFPCGKINYNVTLFYLVLLTYVLLQVINHLMAKFPTSKAQLGDGMKVQIFLSVKSF